MRTEIEALLEPLAEIADLGRARALLAWDERTKMPPRGAPMRAEQIATLTALRAPAARLRRARPPARRGRGGLDGAPHDSFEASLVRVDPARLGEGAPGADASCEPRSPGRPRIAEHAWEARARNPTSPSFLPYLERVVELKRRYIECFEFEHPYDPLLDDFEPGMRTAELRPVLERLRDGVVPLLAAIVAGGIELDASPLHGDFPSDAQGGLAQEVAAAMPLEPEAWRLDSTVHPFAVGIAISDLRITTRFDPEYVGTALWAVMHEAGHALYENGLARSSSARRCADRSRSASTSRRAGCGRTGSAGAGRSWPGCCRCSPTRFGEPFERLGVERLYRAANVVAPSLIRVEADEVTYNLHVILRFELEQQIFDGTLALADLPEAWNARMQEYFGIEVPDDADGVLQDVHWSAGAFGYFPTYSLGNVIAAPGLGARPRGARRPRRAARRRRARAAARVPAERIYRHGGKLEPARDDRAGDRRRRWTRVRSCAISSASSASFTGYDERRRRDERTHRVRARDPELGRQRLGGSRGRGAVLLRALRLGDRGRDAGRAGRRVPHGARAGQGRRRARLTADGGRARRLEHLRHGRGRRRDRRRRSRRRAAA